MKALIVLSHCLFCLLTVATTAVPALIVPEKLLYDVSWAGIKAGSSVQEVALQDDELHIVNTIRSSGLLSAILSVDDKMESVIPRKSPSGLPRLFRENINEGRTHHLKEAAFDFTRLTVHSKDLLKRTETIDPITNRTYDRLSSVYFIRSIELTPGQSIPIELYDFKHLWNAAVKVVKREEIRTPLGKFMTVKVTSQLAFNGKSAPAGDTTMWFTDDSRHIPVRIITKLKVGEVTLTLVGGSYWP